MFQISPVPLPAFALLSRYASRPGHHTDCFVTEIEGQVSIAEYTEAFFHSPVLRIERQLLRLIAPASSYAQVQALATGTGTTLAGWELESRTEDQLLLSVMGGGIRTWLMVEEAGDKTRLLFGSAVIPRNADSENPKIDWHINALMGFHNLYSRIVLAAARGQLKRMTRNR